MAWPNATQGECVFRKRTPVSADAERSFHRSVSPVFHSEHRVTSRATATGGYVQPEMTDPPIANKRTFQESNSQITLRVQVA